MRAAIVIGHDKTSPGAYSPFLGMSEYLYNSEVASYLHEFCIYRRPIGGGYKTQMRLLAEQINKEDFDLVVELHFNMFDGIANEKGEGVETVSYPGNTYTKELGNKFCKLISEEYNTKSRGAKEGIKNGRGWHFLDMIATNAIIVEPFFGDELEAEKFENPGVYAEVIKRWLK